MMKHALLALPFLAVSACATLSEDQCRAADWGVIGEADGADGRTPDYIEKHARACNKFGIAPVRATWEAGRQSGLPRYCRPARAWEEGAHGRRLAPVCPAEKVAELSRVNDRGLRYYRIGQEIEEAERDIHRINATLADLPADYAGRAALITERAALRLDILTLRATRTHYRY